MGVSKETYIGPYVKIRAETQEYDKTLTSCPNEPCENHGSELETPYCNMCGSKSTEITVKREGVLSFADFMESTDYCYEIDLWVPETLSCMYRDDNCDVVLFGLSDHEWVTEVFPDDIGEGLRNLFVEHKDAINAMKEFFGDKMSVHYGVCTFYS